MTYVLILVVSVVYGAGATTAEFSSRDTCEAAGAAAVKALSSFGRSVSFSCSPK